MRAHNVGSFDENFILVSSAPRYYSSRPRRYSGMVTDVFLLDADWSKRLEFESTGFMR
jgi:hypothetical protein